MPGLPYLTQYDDYVQTLASAAPANFTFGGTADADFPVTNIGDQDPSNPFKTPDTSATIDIDMGAAVPIGVIALIHTNLVGGSPATAQVLLDDNSSFTSPVTVEIPISPYQDDGQPSNHLLDLVEAGTGEQTFRYVRLILTSAIGVTVGEVVIGPAWLELHADLQLGATDEEGFPTIENESDAGGVTTVYEHLVRRRWLRGTLRLELADGEALREWHRSTRGRGNASLIHPHLPTDEPWYVRWEKPTLTRSRLFQDEASGAFCHDWQVGFEEIPRGLKPEPDGNV